MSCAVLLFYTALAVALFHQGWSHPSTKIIGDCCDSLIAISYLQSTGIALLHGHQPFITPYLNAPHGVNALWQASSSISLGVVATPFEAFLGPVTTYNLFATLALSLSGWSAYLVIRRFVSGYSGPVVGGLIFGFSSFMTVQSIGHLDLTFIALIPPALGLVAYLVLGRTRSPIRAGMALGVLLVAQLLINQEILLDLVIAGVVLACALAIAFRARVARAWRTWVVGALSAAVTFVVVGAWPLWAIVYGPLRPASLNVVPSIPADLMSFIAPSPIINVDPLWVRTFDSGWFPDNVDQSSAYIGVALLFVTVAAVVALRRRRAVVAAAGWTLVMALLSMGPHLRVANHVTGVPLPWIVLDHLPLVRFAVTARLTLFMWLGIAFVIAVVVQSAQSGQLAHRVLWFTRIFAGCALLFPSTSFSSFSLATPTLFTNPALAKTLPSGREVYVAPFPREQEPNIAPMLWQAETGMRFDMPGGYVYVPTRRGALQSMVSSVDALSSVLLAMQAGAPVPPPSSFTSLRGVLRDDRAAEVLVGPMAHERRVTAFFTDMLGVPPKSMGGVYLWQLGEGL